MIQLKHMGIVEILLLLLVLFVYLLPAIIAGIRNHKNAIGITLLDILLGWTVVGWIVALVWAFNNQGK